MEKIILVTGANGQLGRELKDLSNKLPAYKFLFTSREELPVDENEALDIFFNAHKISYCINCAAYTAVDKAETEKDQAFSINAAAAGKLASLCKKHQAVLIHISTDYVYQGSARNIPLKETDLTGPLNVYGTSKLKGEQLALDRNPNTIIIRTSWVYSSYGTNFVKTMLRLFSEKEEIKVVEDQVGSPTYAADLAAVILLFIQKIEAGKHFSGIYNYSNSGVTNWYEFALTIKGITNSKCRVMPTTSATYISSAKRPGYSVVDTSKIREALQMNIPGWKESLGKCLNKMMVD